MSGRWADLMQLARGHFARGIERRLEQLTTFSSMNAMGRAALAHAHAGAMLSLLEWWLDRGAQQSAAEMDALFHQTVWRAVQPR